MKPGYELFAYSKTKYSEWSYFVLPENFRKNNITNVLSNIISKIYEDFDIRTVADDLQGFYYFPLDSYIVCLRVRNPNLSDISGRPFWDFVGIAAEKKYEQQLRKYICSHIDFAEIYKRVETEYRNYEKPAPVYPHHSPFFETETDEHITVPDIMPEYKQIFSKVTSAGNPLLIIQFPGNKEASERLIKYAMLSCQLPIYIAYGPGSGAFSSEIIYESREIRLGNLNHIIFQKPVSYDTHSVQHQEKYEKCEIRRLSVDGSELSDLIKKRRKRKLFVADVTLPTGGHYFLKTDIVEDTPYELRKILRKNKWIPDNERNLNSYIEDFWKKEYSASPYDNAPTPIAIIYNPHLKEHGEIRQLVLDEIKCRGFMGRGKFKEDRTLYVAESINHSSNTPYFIETKCDINKLKQTLREQGWEIKESQR